MTRSMAKDFEDRKKKRPRLSAVEAEAPTVEPGELGKKITDSDGGALKVLEPGAQENSPTTKVDRALRSRSSSKKVVNVEGSELKSVETPGNALPDKGKKSRGDTSPEQGSKAVDTLLSLHKLKESERAYTPIDNGDPNFKILLQSAVSLSGHAKSPGKGTNSPDALQQESLEDLENYIRTLNGVLEEGWRVEIQRQSKKLKKVRRIYVSPGNEKFRSRIEVARHLGVFRPSHAGNGNPASNVGNGVENSTLDVTDNGRRSAEVSQLGREDQMAQSQEEAPHERNKKDSLSTSGQCCEKVPVIAKSGQSMKYEKKEGTELPVKLQTARKKHPSAMLITQHCQNVLRDIISAEKFGALSNILSRRSPLGSLEAALQPKSPSSISSSLDLQLIALRLATGAYGQTPEMFSADVQQVWKNIMSVGNELVALAKILSELSDSLYKKEVLTLFPGESEDEPSTSNPLNEVGDKEENLVPSAKDIREHHKQLAKCSFPVPDESPVMKETEATPVKNASGREAHKEANSSHSSKATVKSRSQDSMERDKRTRPSRNSRRLNGAATESACKKCGLKQGADCIVCTECNAAYHSYCVTSMSTEFPDKKWYCALCAPMAILQDPGIGSSSKETGEVARNSHEEASIPGQSVDKPSETNLAHLLTLGKEDIGPHKVGSAEETSNDAQGLSLIPAQIEEEKSEMSLEHPKMALNGGVCKVCGKDGNEVICYACEAAYHMNCVIPPVEGVGDENWCCPTCIKDGKKAAALDDLGPADGHQCSVCDRISGKALITSETELVDHPSLPSNGNACKLCGSDEGKKSIISCSGCEKQYHMSCLKPPLKKVPAGIWYCPSCLCRLCKVDVDDDKILLCDSCDEGYHTYCLTPPLTDVPDGSWYCPSCALAKKQNVKAISSESVLVNSVDNKNTPTELSKRKRKSTEPRRSF